MKYKAFKWHRGDAIDFSEKLEERSPLEIETFFETERGEFRPMPNFVWIYRKGLEQDSNNLELVALIYDSTIELSMAFNYLKQKLEEKNLAEKVKSVDYRTIPKEYFS